jgi:hypothetical protein
MTEEDAKKLLKSSGSVSDSFMIATCLTQICIELTKIRERLDRGIDVTNHSNWAGGPR